MQDLRARFQEPLCESGRNCGRRSRPRLLGATRRDCRRADSRLVAHLFTCKSIDWLTRPLATLAPIDSAGEMAGLGCTTARVAACRHRVPVGESSRSICVGFRRAPAPTPARGARGGAAQDGSLHPSRAGSRRAVRASALFDNLQQMISGDPAEKTRKKYFPRVDRINGLELTIKVRPSRPRATFLPARLPAPFWMLSVALLALRIPVYHEPAPARARHWVASRSWPSRAQELSDDELRAKASELRERVQGGASLDSVLEEAFALGEPSSRAPPSSCPTLAHPSPPTHTPPPAPPPQCARRAPACWACAPSTCS